ncbi:MAG TPA: dihydrolipoyl dehydrogenase [bacterium]|nr:dihydrolipoyl dehydrogenase [bacterium]
MSSYDLAVIGAGPGGLEAAIRAKELGLRTVLIEKKNPGGTCLNQGCIPTKTLLASSRFLTRIKDSSHLGIATGDVRCEWQGLLKRKRAVVELLRKASHEQIRKAQIDWIHGTARIVGRKEIHVRGEEDKHIEAESILIATGSTPADLPNLKLDGKNILSSTDVMEMEELPKSLLIVGGGAVGVEFASLFHALGVKITLIEILDRLLPGEDGDCVRRLETLFTRRGIQVMTGLTIAEIRTGDGTVTAVLNSGESVEAEKILLGVGRKRNTSDLGLEGAGIHLEKNGAIPVNDHFETPVRGIYAVGDCTNIPQLAHLASHAGILVAESLGGQQKRVINLDAVPNCIYSDPEVASVGLGKVKEKAEKGETLEVKLPFSAVSKAQIEGEKDGFLKLFASKDRGIILGAAGIGSHITELMPEIVLAVRLRLTARDIYDTLHAHPTESEILQMAARQLAKQI